MIIGIGADLCNIERIGAALARHGERFERRIFTEEERATATARPNMIAAAYAKRFAAKEACAKALGTGFSKGVSASDIAVRHNAAGAPNLLLSGGAKARLAELTPRGHRAVIHLSLSDDDPWAQAFVVIEAVPPSGCS